MIKNIIFDLGKVVLDYNPKEYLLSKISDEDKVRKLFEIIFCGEEWLSLDEGTITEEEAIEKICLANKELEEYIRLSFDNWYPLLNIIESTVNLIEQLKSEGYKLYYLSNFHEKAFEYVNEEYPVFKLFDGGVVSYKEKLMKPNSKIYKLILERYNLKAEECIFIDDTKANIEAAEKMGIQGIHLVEPNELSGLIKKRVSC